ncbi:stimulus-sensing domain-containing protein [Mariluticola halotolerans]|uniref:stimulus-sensing domain-containing protein n=1 Tax=Mariluticola halotolerans TaxID=2909283 RepID=UPI0026E1CBB8|nr:stimulus-sensing domain-containing protein [Mariluticola halotolerans]UJQ93328.1 sensor histidine kinase [Mariluticola halotolerans]
MAIASDELETAKKSPAQVGQVNGTKKRARFGLWARLRALVAAIRRFLGVTIFSNLTRRIVFLNLAALAALVAGILYLNQWRAGLIEARVQSLRIQGQIISAAIAASATVDSDVISVNPDRLLEVLPGNAISPLSFFDPTLEFPISPERVAPLLGELVTPTHTRARIYDKDGLLILDSANIYARGQVLLPTQVTEKGSGFFLTDWWNAAMTWVPGSQFSLYQEYDASEGKRYPEVNIALTGAPADIVRVDQQGQLVVSVAVPVQRSRAIVGALLLSTQPGEIDTIIATERLGILRIALIAAISTSILSFFLAGTIAGPMRRLSAAAERVQASMTHRAEIPDFTDRTDEIGHLSGALRAMTNALYNRIEAIERFAADVAHELKNPLTSLRSAVETLPLVKRKEDRDRLTAIIQHDVRRLDRLISDISNASRLDAELARESAEIVDVQNLSEAMASIQEDLAATRGITINVTVTSDRYKPLVLGHDSRLAQVFNNLIDNAVSFSPDGGKVEVRIEADADNVIVEVCDEGPGIQGDPERIFQRFYTDRPEAEHFGDHSGLGLSISRQIIEAHKGTISGVNRTDAAGATFKVTLPRSKK